jgi:hypothetical protein
MFTLSVHRVKVRYKQSVVGPSWAVLQPLSPGPPASPNGGRQPCLPGSLRNDLHAARDVEAPQGAERGEVPRAGPQ